MHGGNGSSFLATLQGIRPRGPRPHPALIATAMALLACLGVAGCAGHAAPATGSPPGAPSPTGAARSSAAAPAPLAWSAARAPLPADANRVSGQYASLDDVTCAAVGNCVAVGFDKAKGPTGDVTQGLVETLSGGKWTASPAPLPADAATTGQVAGLWAVSCAASGTCVAAGHYIQRGGQPRSPR